MNRLVLIILCILSLGNTTYAGDYPKSKVEREMEEMGSIAGGEGVIFRPKLVKSSATKAKIGNVNKYLYLASIETLKFAPLSSVDSDNGIILTDWYVPKGQKDTQLKVNVFIRDDVISPSAIEVNVYERTRTHGTWSQEHTESPIASVLEGKILKKARELYLKSQKDDN